MHTIENVNFAKMNGDGMDAMPKPPVMTDGANVRRFLREHSEKLVFLCFINQDLENEESKRWLQIMTIGLQAMAKEKSMVKWSFVNIKPCPNLMLEFQLTGTTIVVFMKEKEKTRFSVDQVKELMEYIEANAPAAPFSGQGRSLGDAPNPTDFLNSLRRVPSAPPQPQPQPQPQPKPVIQTQPEPQSTTKKPITGKEEAILRDELSVLGFTDDEIERAIRAGMTTIDDCIAYLDQVPAPEVESQPLKPEPVAAPAPVRLTWTQTELLNELKEVLREDEVRLALEITGSDDEGTILKWIAKYQAGEIDVEVERKKRLAQNAVEAQKQDEDTRRRMLEAEALKKKQMEDMLEKKRVADSIKRQRELQRSSSSSRPPPQKVPSSSGISPVKDVYKVRFYRQTKPWHTQQFPRGTTYRDLLAHIREQPDISPESTVSLVCLPSMQISESELDNAINGDIAIRVDIAD